MLLYMYQIFSSLQSHLHFFVYFFFTFMEYFFLDTLYFCIMAFGMKVTFVTIKNEPYSYATIVHKVFEDRIVSIHM